MASFFEPAPATARETTVPVSLAVWLNAPAGRIDVDPSTGLNDLVVEHVHCDGGPEAQSSCHTRGRRQTSRRTSCPGRTA